MNEKLIIITGGAGFIGSQTIHHILKNRPNNIVVNVDKLSYAGNIKNLDGIDYSRHVHTPTCITDKDTLDQVFEDFSESGGIEGVIHFAASSHVDSSISNPDEFIHTNIVGTFNLLETSRKHNVKKFYHFSTEEVFGALGPTDPPFKEGDPYRPNSPYSASKASSDLLVRSYCKTYNFPGIITNCSNNYGPRQHVEKLIPKVISNALQNKEIPIYDKGLQIRDWIFVDDCAEVILKVFEEGRIGESYNIGGECELTNIEIVKTILDIMGKPHSLITYVEDRPGHDFRYAVNCDKIKKELNWAPSTPLVKGLEKTIEYYDKRLPNP